MKVKFTLLILMFFCHILNAQDLIITTEGEILNCRITKVDEEHIYYTYNFMGNVNEASISRIMVKTFKTSGRGPESVSF